MQWEEEVQVKTILCDVRRPRTNVHCNLPINHTSPLHVGFGKRGVHCWSAIHQQLEFPLGPAMHRVWKPISRSLEFYEIELSIEEIIYSENTPEEQLIISWLR